MTKYFLLFLAILPVAFLQAVVGSFNFLLVLILIATFLLSPTKALTAAFLAGVIFDLFSGGRVGYSSLGFLVPSFLIIIYRRRFSLGNPFLLIGIILASYVIVSFATGKPLVWFEGLVLVAIVLILRFLIPSAFQGEQEREQRLRL